MLKCFAGEIGILKCFLLYSLGQYQYIKPRQEDTYLVKFFLHCYSPATRG